MTSGTLFKQTLSKLKKIFEGSTMLFLLSTIAIIIANSPLNGIYQDFLNYPINIAVGDYNIFSHHGQPMTLSQFVNDALMAVFFFVVGLEIKQEILVGELSSAKKALLPVIAAFGGMIVPVIMFLLVCHSQPESFGAAIPMATDIAFALAMLSVLGSRVPYSLKIFLTALAVVDDIGGIIIIALFYSSHVEAIYLLFAAIVLVISYIAGRKGVHDSSFYYIVGFIVWTLFLKSGIHPTIAGVLVALSAPAKTHVHLSNLQQRLRDMFDMLPKAQHRESGESVILSHEQICVINEMRQTTRKAVSPVQIMENEVSPLVKNLILPLFAFVNAGVCISDIDINSIFGLPLAITLGLFPGKAIGIFLFTVAAVKTGICSMPEGMNQKNLFALSVFGGIGFTVSLFIANLSFGNHIEMLNQAKLGIFAGTIISAAIGLFLLRTTLPNARTQSIIPEREPLK